MGNRFKKAFNKVKVNLKENPKIFKEVETNQRRAILSSSFPYTVHYLVNTKSRTVKIIGVFHQSKNIDLVKEKVNIRKIHELRKDQNQEYIKRQNRLKQIRQRQELEKDRGQSRDLER